MQQFWGRFHTRPNNPRIMTLVVRLPLFNSQQRIRRPEIHHALTISRNAAPGLEPPGDHNPPYPPPPHAGVTFGPLFLMPEYPPRPDCRGARRPRTRTAGKAGG